MHGIARLKSHGTKPLILAGNGFRLLEASAVTVFVQKTGFVWVASFLGKSAPMVVLATAFTKAKLMAKVSKFTHGGVSFVFVG